MILPVDDINDDEGEEPSTKRYKNSTIEIGDTGFTGRALADVSGHNGCRRLLSAWRNASVAEFAIETYSSVRAEESSSGAWDLWKESGRDVEGNFTPLQDWATQSNVTLSSTTLKVNLGHLPNPSIAPETLLRPYEGLATPAAATESDPPSMDLIANAGGPIWTLEFAPNSYENNYESYIALGTSRIGFPVLSDPLGSTRVGKFGVGSDTPHVIGEKNTCPNLLQIWVLLNSATVADASPPTITKQLCLSYFVDLKDRGSVWSLQWKRNTEPTKNDITVQDSDNNLTEQEASSATGIGVLAVVCGDGGCLLLTLPRRPSAGLDVLDEESVRICRLCAANTLILSICWIESNEGLSAGSRVVRLLGGLADGGIGLWVLDLSVVDRNGKFLGLM